MTRGSRPCALLLALAVGGVALLATSACSSRAAPAPSPASAAAPRAAAPRSDPGPAIAGNPRPAAATAASAAGAHNDRAGATSADAADAAVAAAALDSSWSMAAAGAGSAPQPGQGMGWGRSGSAAQTPLVALPVATGSGWHSTPRFAGVATYYGWDFQGQPMASGPIFDMNDPTVTAANYWPLGTRLRLRRIPGGPWDGLLDATQRNAYFSNAIVVTVRDRGAFTHALDLSYAAFGMLGRPDEGVIRVMIEQLDP